MKRVYLHHTLLSAPMGLKICASGLKEAIAGTELLRVGPEDDIEDLKANLDKGESIFSGFELKPEGVLIKASTLGSIEALVSFLGETNVPVAAVGIGEVREQDVIQAAVMKEQMPENAAILAFDVAVSEEAMAKAEQEGVQIFREDIIYRLQDTFANHMRRSRRGDDSDEAVFPVVLAIDETEFKEEGMEGDYETQPQSVEFVHFQPNSPRNVLAAGCGNGVCMIYELSANHVRWVKQRELNQPDTELNGFTKAVWLNVSGETGATRGGPRLLATGDIKGTIRVWDAAGGFEVGKIENENEENKSKLPEFCLSELGGHEAAVMHIELFAKCLLTCSEDGTCKIFDLSGEEDRV